MARSDGGPTTDQRGLEIPRDVLGAEHVDRSLQNASEFTVPCRSFLSVGRLGWKRRARSPRTRSGRVAPSRGVCHGHRLEVAPGEQLNIARASPPRLPKEARLARSCARQRKAGRKTLAGSFFDQPPSIVLLAPNVGDSSTGSVRRLAITPLRGDDRHAVQFGRGLIGLGDRRVHAWQARPGSAPRRGCSGRNSLQAGPRLALRAPVRLVSAHGRVRFCVRECLRSCVGVRHGRGHRRGLARPRARRRPPHRGGEHDSVRYAVGHL
jgi:hypothetical protein